MTQREEIKILAGYVDGYGAAQKDKRLQEAAEWLEQLADHICAGGIIGCGGGDNCTSDHK